MILTNRLYEIMKWTALVLLPALSMFYAGLADVWGLPYSEQVVGTIAVIDLFLGTILGISTNIYKVNNPAYRVNLAKLVGEIKGSWILPTNMYEILSWVAQIFLPALATLYFAMSTIWGLAYGEQIVTTIMAIDAFLGALLGFSTAQFHKKSAKACVDNPDAWVNFPD